MILDDENLKHTPAGKPTRYPNVGPGSSRALLKECQDVLKRVPFVTDWEGKFRCAWCYSTRWSAGERERLLHAKACPRQAVLRKIKRALEEEDKWLS